MTVPVFRCLISTVLGSNNWRPEVTVFYNVGNFCTGISRVLTCLHLRVPLFKSACGSSFQSVHGPLFESAHTP